MPDDYKQRTFLPDEDVDYESLWPPPKPPRPRERAPMHEWMPGAIFLGCYAAFLLACLAEWLIK